MSKLDWLNALKDYQQGVDRGVLYFGENDAFAWDGLISVTEDSSESDTKPLYFEGVLVNLDQDVSDYKATVEAFIYPYMLGDYVVGLSDGGTLSGTLAENQPFGFTYRTMTAHGYRLHLVYNVVATIDNITYSSLDDRVDLNPFTFDFYTTPTDVPNARPSSHIFIDSTETSPGILMEVESILYGSETTSPRFPTVAELVELFTNLAL